MAQRTDPKSTIVRLNVLALRALFRSLEVIAPALGALIAEPMWFRVPGSRGRSGSERSARARPNVAQPNGAQPNVAQPNGAQPNGAQPDVAPPNIAPPNIAPPNVAPPNVAPPYGARPNRHTALAVSTGTRFEVCSQAHAVRGEYWGHGPVVYLLHGWGGSSTQMRYLVSPLVATGHQVVAHDSPSHGRSDAGMSGRNQSNVVEMGRALQAVVARFGQPHAIVTHSMGALATMLALREGWISSSRLVLISPVSGVPDFSAIFRDRLGFGTRTQRRIEQRATRRVGYPVHELDVRHLAREVERPQLLVVHDELDRETPYAASADLVGSWPGARFLPTWGLGHHRILRDLGVIEAVSWFVNHGPVTLNEGESAEPPKSARHSHLTPDAAPDA